jgi:sugar phosphate isomerase/epimerase
MSYPLILHVNYVEQGQTISEMCHKAVAWGYDGIEFRRVRRGVDETPEAYLDALAAAVEKSGMTYPMFGGPGPSFGVDDAERRKQELEEALKFYRLAAERFTLRICNVGAGVIPATDKSAPGWAYDKQGSGAATEAHYEWAAAAYRELGALAEELGFKMAFETHMGCLTDLPEPTLKLLEMIDSPAVGANLDYGNMVQFQKPPRPQEAIDVLRDRIFMLHMKNVYRVNTAERVAMIPCGMADGVINQREFLRMVLATGFVGPLCAESPRAGDREWFAQEDFRYLQSLRNELITLAG